MERDLIDIVSFGACLGALVRTLFGLRIDLHWCAAAGAGAVYVLHRGIDFSEILHLLPPHALEAGAALYFASLLLKRLRETPARNRYTPRRFA